MIGYVKCFGSNKAVSFKASDNKLLKNYTEIWESVNSLMKKEFDCELVYDDSDKYIKIKIKLYGDKVNTYFQGKRIKWKILSIIIQILVHPIMKLILILIMRLIMNLIMGLIC